MNDKNMQELIVSYVAAKLAIDQERKISELKLELAKKDHETAWEELNAMGFSGQVRIGNAVVLSPQDFRALLRCGPSETLIIINAVESQSVEVPCAKILDRYFPRFQ